MIPADMLPFDLEKLEREIGRKLSPDDFGKITDLNDVPETLISEAKKLHRWTARDLLAYYVTSDSRPYFRSFVEEVVFYGKPAHTWRRGGVLIPLTSLTDQLCKSREALLAPIGGAVDMRFVPDYGDWPGDAYCIGVPAKPWPEMNYKSSVPEGARDFVSPELEPIKDLGPAVRRWIAVRIAVHVYVKGGVPQTVEELFSLITGEPPMDHWSEDARIAAAGLVREYRELGAPAEGEIPGFRGPDSYFAGE